MVGVNSARNNRPLVLCSVCRAVAHHKLDRRVFCCKHFDEAIEHGAAIPGNFGELLYLAEIGSVAAAMMLRKQDESRRQPSCDE
jgi:hypothetical protein